MNTKELVDSLKKVVPPALHPELEPVEFPIYLSLPKIFKRFLSEIDYQAVTNNLGATSKDYLEEMIINNIVDNKNFLEIVIDLAAKNAFREFMEDQK